MQQYHYYDPVILPIHPTVDEKRYIDDTMFACVYVYNTLLQEISDRWRFQNIITPTNILDYSAMVSEMKKRPNHAFLDYAPSTPVRNSAFTLLRDFKAFFRTKSGASYPKPIDVNGDVFFRLSAVAFRLHKHPHSIVPQGAFRYGLHQSGILIPGSGNFHDDLNGIDLMRSSSGNYAAKLLRGAPIDP